MKKQKIDVVEYIKNNTIRLEASHRGGGIEIDAEEFVGLDGAKMTAYQNYLGGGMLGSIQSSKNFTTGKDEKMAERAEILAEALKKYFHNITNEEAGDYDEWNAGEFEAVQNRPESAY